MTIVSAREFNQDVSAAKRAATAGPVIITDRGRPSHVLLSIDEFNRLTGAETDLVEALAMDVDVAFEPEPAGLELRIPGL